MIDFSRLIAQLNTAGIQQKQPALYQVIKSLIENLNLNNTSITDSFNTLTDGLNNTLTYGTTAWLASYKPQNTVGHIVLYLATDTGILYIFDSITQTWIQIGINNEHFLTWQDDSAILPNSRQLLAGNGISFDDSVAHQRTISSVVGHQLIPLMTGNYPPDEMGIGQFLMFLPADITH